jgi:hypothetical protein
MQALNVMAQHQLVFDTMRLLNIPLVEVSFSGSGDSGQIDDVSPQVNIDGEPYDQAEVTRRHNIFAEHTLDLGGEPTRLHRLIEDLSDDLLQARDIPDWYNNDGGNGSIKWHTADAENPDHIEMEVNTAQVSYDTTEFSFDCYGRRVEE